MVQEGSGLRLAALVRACSEHDHHVQIFRHRVFDDFLTFGLQKPPIPAYLPT